MKMKDISRRLALAALTLALAVLADGCKSSDFHSAMRADAAQPSNFLPKRNRLVRQRDTFPFHYFYLDRNAPRYRYVYIAPVDTSSLRRSNGWAEFDKALQGRLGGDVEDLAKFMRKAYVQAFRKAATSPANLKPVDRTDLPGTLVLETAIVALVPTKAELNYVGTAAFFLVPIPGLGLVASYFASGSITVECRIRDARTGRVVAMYSTTESDPKALISVSGYTWTASARINVKKLAALTARVLAAKDYRKIKRDFPLQFFSFVHEGELDREKTNKTGGGGKTAQTAKATKGAKAPSGGTPSARTGSGTAK